jgi:hypothetical protein
LTSALTSITWDNGNQASVVMYEYLRDVQTEYLLHHNHNVVHLCGL